MKHYTDEEIKTAARLCADTGIECPEECPLADCEDCNAVFADMFIRYLAEAVAEKKHEDDAPR